MPIRILVFTLIAWLGPGSTNAAQETERIDFYYGIAEGNYLIGDLGGAERGIEQMLRINPNHLPALRLKARVTLAAGKPDAAIAAMGQAIAVYENESGQESLAQRTTLRLERARLLALLGRFEAAIQDLQIVTGQQPENFEALITLASLYASVGRWESLEAVLAPIAQRPELRDVALYLEGRAALAKNRIGTARAKFESAIEALPKEADLLRRSLFFYRGLCLEKLGRQDEAESEILNAIDAGFRPETREEVLSASRILLRAERGEEAIPLLEAITLTRIEPGAAVWTMLGRAHLATDTPALALSALNESLRISPEQTEARALRGALLRKIGDLEGALADFKAALQRDPDGHAVRYALGLTYLQLGRIQEAEASIGQAAAALKDQAGLHLLHALLAYAVGERTGANTSLRAYQAIVLDKQNPSAVYLDYLLQPEEADALSDDAIGQYFLGKYDRKKALDQAGRAESPEEARQQICAAAFWMAQWEAMQGAPEKSLELLAIAVEAGQPDFTEYQLAKWQLKKEALP